jgi:hypothetical protein
MPTKRAPYIEGAILIAALGYLGLIVVGAIKPGVEPIPPVATRADH